MTRAAIYIDWTPSSYFGWGVYGLNLALHWTADPEITAIGTHPVSPRVMAVDPLRMRVLRDFIGRSEVFHTRLAAFSNGVATVERPLLRHFDERFTPSAGAHGVVVSGKPTIGVTFFETAQLKPDAVARAAQYPLIVTGSTWNEEVLRAHDLTNVCTVLQGIDPTLFYPGPRIGHLSDRFLVFSGGKLERRKGQDIVIAAFRRFAETRPDALLVTAWHSPWPDVAQTLDAGGLVEPVIFDDAGKVDVLGWAAANGIGAQNILDLGMISNAQMPPVLREIDVALFPNRAEGGTNLVAMECMACGVPVILSANTGHLDLIEDGACYPLTQQGALPGREAGHGAATGWGESDVDEIVEQLERAYRHREEARVRGARGAAKLGGLTWAKTAREMKAIALRPWS